MPQTKRKCSVAFSVFAVCCHKTHSFLHPTELYWYRQGELGPLTMHSHTTQWSQSRFIHGTVYDISVVEPWRRDIVHVCPAVTASLLIFAAGSSKHLNGTERTLYQGSNRLHAVSENRFRANPSDKQISGHEEKRLREGKKEILKGVDPFLIANRFRTLTQSQSSCGQSRWSSGWTNWAERLIFVFSLM